MSVLSGCATRSAAESPALPVAVREKIDSAAEAEIAQQEARATAQTMASSTLRNPTSNSPTSTSPAAAQNRNAPGKDETATLLRSLIVNGDLADAGAIAREFRSLKNPSPMI
jgi:hypothetical protein